MQVQSIQQNKVQKNKEPQFKGIADTALRFLATNQGVGANVTDVCFMVAPRVATDAKRGPDACVETLRREASGTFNHSMIGVYGVAAGATAAALMGLGNKFGTNANEIFAAPETINILAENKSNQLKNKTLQLDYLKETFKNVKAFNPNAVGADKDGFVKLSQETIDELSKIFDNALNDKNMDFNTWKKHSTSDSLQVAMNKMIEATGAESKYILESADGKISSVTPLENLLKDIYKVSDSFNKDKVKAAFEEQIRNGKSIKENAFLQKFSKFLKSRAIAGVAIGSLVGMSVQPLNVYLTKLKTGSDGFVGVEGRSKDTSAEFKLMKGVAAVGFGGLTMWTLGTGFKGLMDKMAFKVFFPTISQLKGIYGLTIISRLLATRDKDELRESLTKDTLGFLSWLVLGDFVNRMTAEASDKSVMNRTKEVADNKNFFKRVFNSTLKTRDEILIETLAKNGVATVKKDGDKTIAKTFKELMKELDKLPEQIKKSTKKRLGTLNKAQLVGYAFSGLVLGIGIPNLNIYITNKLDKQRKEKAAKAM
ncbi:hypothetical protein IJ384_01705 [bacterium]|nr:hypothetical protein [bacterium]